MYENKHCGKCDSITEHILGKCESCKRRRRNTPKCQSVSPEGHLCIRPLHHKGMCRRDVAGTSIRWDSSES